MQAFIDHVYALGISAIATTTTVAPIAHISTIAATAVFSNVASVAVIATITETRTTEDGATTLTAHRTQVETLAVCREDVDDFTEDNADIADITEVANADTDAAQVIVAAATQGAMAESTRQPDNNEVTTATASATSDVTAAPDIAANDTSATGAADAVDVVPTAAAGLPGTHTTVSTRSMLTRTAHVQENSRIATKRKITTRDGAFIPERKDAEGPPSGRLRPRSPRNQRKGAQTDHTLCLTRYMSERTAADAAPTVAKVIGTRSHPRATIETKGNMPKRDGTTIPGNGTHTEGPPSGRLRSRSVTRSKAQRRLHKRTAAPRD